MKKIITTVGTSVLTNYQKQEVELAWKTSDEKNYTPINLKELEDKPASEYGKHSSKISDMKKNITNFWLFGIERRNDGSYLVLDNEKEPNHNASAEIKSILKIAEEAREDVEVYLLATDTVLSRLACELIVGWFQIVDKEGKEIQYIHKLNDTSIKISVKFEASPKFICEGLRVVGEKSGDDFAEKGFFSLIENIEHHKPDMLCFSGGYKSIIPIMTIIGQIKGLPLYCVYEDDNSSLIEIGNLPINFDWGLTQLLKPFLSVEHHPIWQNNGKELAKKIATGDIKFENQVFVSDICNQDDLKDNQNRLLIFKALFEHKLINKDLNITLFGKLFQKVSELENYRGYEMEYIFHHYFYHENTKKNSLVESYNVVPAYEFVGSFKNEKNGIEVCEKISTKTYPNDIGDIDLPMCREKINVLGEVKAFSKLLDYEKEEKGKKYLHQLEARLKLFCLKYPDKIVVNENNEAFLELFFIVHQFQFEDYKTSIIEMKLVKTVYDKFKALNDCVLHITKDGKKIKVTPIFRLAGVKCLIGIDTSKMLANYMSFYKKPKFEWEILSE